jgi:nucleoside-diphosphate-sugar epimerase
VEPWSYIDARDGAEAGRRALAHEATDLDVFVIANADTVMSRKTSDLVAEGFPEARVRKERGEHESLLSSDKAHRILGYQPARPHRGVRHMEL